MYFHIGVKEEGGLQFASFVCWSLNKIKGQAICLSHSNWSYYWNWIQSYSKQALWRERVRYSPPFPPVSLRLLRSPVLTFQIKCSANLYSWWKVLIAWETERRFLLAGRPTASTQGGSFKQPTIYLLSFFVRSPIPAPHIRREKKPLWRTTQESR